MATKTCDRKRVSQQSVDILFSVRDYAVKQGYNSVVAKRIAVVALDGRNQSGIHRLAESIKSVCKKTAYGGHQSASTFNRLTKGRTLKHRLNIKDYLNAYTYHN
jgi:hypothetical protein